MAEAETIGNRTRGMGEIIDVAVNLSGHSLESAVFMAALREIMADDPSLRRQLIFEITESTQITNLVHAANAVRQRHAAVVEAQARQGVRRDDVDALGDLKTRRAGFNHKGGYPARTGRFAGAFSSSRSPAPKSKMPVTTP